MFVRRQKGDEKLTVDLDLKLAEQYGSYASFSTQADPTFTDYFGENPAEEVDRLLAIFAKPDRCFLDLGCGAGQTLCALAPQVKEIWGFDQDDILLDGARARVEFLNIKNATLVLGNVAESDDLARLPDSAFDGVLSRRGPDVNEALLPKLKSDAVLIQELVQDALGLKEIFGRAPFLPQVGSDPHWLIYQYQWLGFLPVSVKDYFYDQFFRDKDHLVAFLQKESMLWHWRMPEFPYDEALDKIALDLYVRYNQTERGIRLTNHRKVYLFRRAEVSQFPAYPEAKPIY